MFRRYAEIVKRVSDEQVLERGLSPGKRYVQLRCPCGEGCDLPGVSEPLIVELLPSHVKVTLTEITYPDLPMPEHYTISGVNGHKHTVRCPTSGRRLEDLRHKE